MMKKLSLTLLILFLCQTYSLSAEYNFDTAISYAKSNKEAKKVNVFDEASDNIDNSLNKLDNSLDKTTEIIKKKSDKIKQKTKNLKEKAAEKAEEIKEKTEESAASLKEKIQEKITIEEEIEQAKKQMDAEAESLEDIYKQASQIKTADTQIFDENNMEVLGKTFWGRKPIHPIAKYGYKGHLPDIASEFEYKKTKDEYKCLIPTNPNATKKDLIPAPRDNKAYVDIVVKKAGNSQYINDVNDVIFILQKIIVNIEDDVNVQRFNAQVSGLLDNIFYIQDKYRNKPEANYVSYYKMLELANVARDTAILRTEAQAYSKYLAYSGEGAMYRPERIQKQMDYFLEEINKTLVVLKAVN